MEKSELSTLQPSGSLRGCWLLKLAIEQQNAEDVSRILQQYESAGPNRLMPGQNMTFLHFAVGLSDNDPMIVNLLLQRRGANPNNVDIPEKLSPLHLSVIYDYDVILKALIRAGGDPLVKTGEGKTCYDIAQENLETEMLEKCFLCFYQSCSKFRMSIKPSDSAAFALRKTHSSSLTSLSDGIFFSCESEFDSGVEENAAPAVAKTHEHNQLSFCYEMTEDESEDSGEKRLLSTINEEGSVNSSALSTPKGAQFGQPKPLSVARFYDSDSTEDLTVSSVLSSSGPSCVNSTPPAHPDPDSDDLRSLQERMTDMKIPAVPVTPSTYRVLYKYAGNESQLAQVLSPKPGTHNFSSELRMCISNLHLVVEWGQLKIDLLQNLTPTGRTSKSFYNYLLLDPRIIKRVNFSGNHLKSDVINSPDKFETFLRSIFYIGKGCGRRPIQHLVDAKARLSTPANRRSSRDLNEDPAAASAGEKIDKILEIWKSGLGVKVVSLFHHSSEREANANEAAMIDAIGLCELSNIKKGSYGGTIATKWSQKTKNQFGSFLLHKSFCTFAVSDTKSFFAKDV